MIETVMQGILCIILLLQVLYSTPYYWHRQARNTTSPKTAETYVQYQPHILPFQVLPSFDFVHHRDDEIAFTRLPDTSHAKDIVQIDIPSNDSRLYLRDIGFRCCPARTRDLGCSQFDFLIFTEHSVYCRTKKMPGN